MSSFSNISIVGNLTRDPEMKVFESSGRKKTTMTVAVNNWSKNKNNQIEKTADFYKVETWDRLAELTSDFLKKGSQVAVSGRLHLENWKDNNGKDRVTPIVKANQIALPQRVNAKPPETAAGSTASSTAITTNGQMSDSQIREAIIKEDSEFDVNEIPPEVLASNAESSQTTSNAPDYGEGEFSQDDDPGESESSASCGVPSVSQFVQTMKVVDPNTNVAETPVRNPPTIESIARSA